MTAPWASASTIAAQRVGWGGGAGASGPAVRAHPAAPSSSTATAVSVRSMVGAFGRSGGGPREEPLDARGVDRAELGDDAVPDARDAVVGRVHVHPRDAALEHADVDVVLGAESGDDVVDPV